jgi:hypothetical protein
VDLGPTLLKFDIASREGERNGQGPVPTSLKGRAANADGARCPSRFFRKARYSKDPPRNGTRTGTNFLGRTVGASRTSQHEPNYVDPWGLAVIVITNTPPPRAGRANGSQWRGPRRKGLSWDSGKPWLTAAPALAQDANPAPCASRSQRVRIPKSRALLLPALVRKRCQWLLSIRDQQPCGRCRTLLRQPPSPAALH